LRPYVRVVFCERAQVSAESRVFIAPTPHEEGAYARTIVLAPAGSRGAFALLESVAEVVYVGDPDARSLDLYAALVELKRRGVYSIFSEGGPTLAARLLAEGLVDRLYWLTAPLLLANENAVRVLRSFPGLALRRRYAFDEIARLGDDVMLSVSFVGESS
jgi:diaminohydroxyphosphoribosylaminopyrimidine deaminase/5-amino-6-(5-phosphoribosylamino)uracil reductase